MAASRRVVLQPGQQLGLGLVRGQPGDPLQLADLLASPSPARPLAARAHATGRPAPSLGASSAALAVPASCWAASTRPRAPSRASRSASSAGSCDSRARSPSARLGRLGLLALGASVLAARPHAGLRLGAPPDPVELGARPRRAPRDASSSTSVGRVGLPGCGGGLFAQRLTAAVVRARPRCAAARSAASSGATPASPSVTPRPGRPRRSLAIAASSFGQELIGRDPRSARLGRAAVGGEEAERRPRGAAKGRRRK